MLKKTGRIGGLAAQNSGTIENSYSVVRLKVKAQTSGGFVGENTGAISKSYYHGRLKGLTGGFAGDGKDNLESSCYFFHHEKEGSKKLEKLCDPIHGQRLKEIQTDEDVQQLGFDADAVWQLDDGKAPLRFIPENWLFDVSESTKMLHYITQTASEGGGTAVLEQTQVQCTVICKAEELWQLAEEINGGNTALASAYVRLDDDIDLGGREWIPIGKDRTCAFTGLFDGCGHTIKNFVIKDKKTENKGFFGFVRGGEIYNLSVDCNIKGGTCAGGLTAQNDGGVIGCCAAVIEIKGKNGTVGGLVGRNTGTIFGSYAAGRVFVVPILWWWWGVPIAGVLLSTALLLPQLPKLSVFAPVPYDQDQVEIPDEVIAPNTDGNFVSFQFEQEISVDLATGLCNFQFKNPGNSNHNIVVQLQFTDAQAVRVMGSTGRAADAQKKLSETPGYDPEAYRTVIAESGAIRPGYQLDELRLVSHANGAVIPPGDYNAMVYLVFYDIDTNNRAMLESQLPVVITVS